MPTDLDRSIGPNMRDERHLPFIPGSAKWSEIGRRTSTVWWRPEPCRFLATAFSSDVAELHPDERRALSVTRVSPRSFLLGAKKNSSDIRFEQHGSIVMPKEAANNS